MWDILYNMEYLSRNITILSSQSFHKEKHHIIVHCLRLPGLFCRQLIWLGFPIDDTHIFQCLLCSSAWWSFTAGTYVLLQSYHTVDAVNSSKLSFHVFHDTIFRYVSY
jgi:hypothetical protein